MTGHQDGRLVSRLRVAMFLLVVGLYSASWSLGFVLACWVVGRVTSALGPFATFSTLAGLSGLSAMLLWFLPFNAVWIGLRMVIGFCFGGLSALVEGWLIARTGANAAFASYLAVVLVASLAGTLSLNLLDPLGEAPFVLTSAAVLASIVPVFLERTALPPAPLAFHAEIGRVIALSPLGAFDCLGAGTITGVLGGLGPVFGMVAGLGMHGTTHDAGREHAGRCRGQYAGQLPDRTDRPALAADRGGPAGRRRVYAAGSCAAMAPRRADPAAGGVRLRAISAVHSVRRHHHPAGAPPAVGTGGQRNAAAVRTGNHRRSHDRRPAAASRNRLDVRVHCRDVPCHRPRRCRVSEDCAVKPSFSEEKEAKRL
ncbi:putative membrane protein [Gluconacetobacter diazotrophicus PA1 5]|uniref:Putative membrane protein n=1 Tax=Gluconacetobacter diazotrophicus (strain ATCC 49037 / DSM 5601 / CCUG 37298 / CIP 103539 / LMG 7603 / PAl5) TaxID=272568 RepID=A9HCS0_GLUDA|nr:putative membrane protein [Gluconacetobacter diazotrophicus PA1 5]